MKDVLGKDLWKAYYQERVIGVMNTVPAAMRMDIMDRLMEISEEMNKRKEPTKAEEKAREMIFDVEGEPPAKRRKEVGR